MMSCRRCPVAVIGMILSDLSHPEQHGTESGDDIACGTVQCTVPQMSLHVSTQSGSPDFSAPWRAQAHEPIEPSTEQAFVKHDGAE